jgi:sugar-specific transcriptional regulator TrmB
MGISSSNEYGEIVSSLSFFGLEQLDSSIYLALLEFDACTMSELATKLDVDRGRIYRSIEKLDRLGIVVLSNSKVTKYEALLPGNAFQKLIDEKQLEVYKLRSILDKVTNELDQISRPQESPKISNFSIIEGRNTIYTRIGKLIQEARNDVYIVTTSDDFVRMSHTAIPEKIKIAKNNDIVIKILLDSENIDFPKLSKVVNAEIHVGNLPSKSRIIVEKDRQIMMSGVIKNTQALNEESESILHSNSYEMTCNMFSLCEQMWKQSTLITIAKNKTRKIQL